MLAGRPHVVETGSGLEVRLGGVPFTQQDLRRLQLAKAAVRTGIGALLEETGTRVEEVERVYVAGSFGAAVDPASAVAIGLFPDIPLDRFVTVGNAAVAGACICEGGPHLRLGWPVGWDGETRSVTVRIDLTG